MAIALNLTDKQRQFVRDLVRLCDTAQHRSFTYTPTFNNRDNVEAHGTNIKASANDRDLKTLENEGLITLKWGRHGAASGTVLPRAYDAAKANFGLPPEAQAPAPAVAPPPAAYAPARSPAAQAPVAHAPVAHAPVAYAPAGVAAHPQASASAPVPPAPADRQPRAAAVAPRSDVPAQVAALLADLVGTLREALPVDESEAAEADAAAIDRQLRTSRPDPEVVARKTRSLVARVASATGSAADLADSGGKLAEAMQKLSPVVALIGHWSAARRAA